MSVYPGFSALTCAVGDLGAATRFYEALGFPLSRGASGAQTSWFALETCALLLRERAASAATHVWPMRGRAAPILTRHLASAREADEAARKWVEAGGRFLRARGGAGRAVFRTFVADPEGLVFEFVHDPALLPGPQGRLVLPP